MTEPRAADNAESKPTFMTLDVVVAEDESLVAAEVVGMLRALGHRVVAQTATGEETLAACEQHRPDIVILDIQLSGSTCIDAAKLVFERLGIPTVILSAYANPDLVVQARNAGVFGYLVKPPQPAQLAAALDVAIARSSEFLQSTERARDLQRQIDERRAVEQAKWILVRNVGLTEPSAMKALQDEARRSQQPLSVVARSVIKSGRLVPADPPKHRP